MDEKVKEKYPNIATFCEGRVPHFITEFNLLQKECINLLFHTYTLESQLKEKNEKIEELEKGINTFDNEAYEEHCLSIATSDSLSKLLKLIKKGK